MTGSETVHILIVSDFNAQGLAGYLHDGSSTPRLEARLAPFGQVIQSLTDFSLPCWQPPTDYLVVWTQPQRVLRSFNALLDFERPPIESVLEEVDSYTRLLLQAAQRVQALFVPNWVVSAYNRGLSLLDLKNDYGIANVLLRANLRLVDNLKESRNIFVLNAQRWMELAGARNAHNPKLWYMGKIGFGNDVFKEAARDLRAALQGMAGAARKLVLLDLDETLWGGIVGDGGWEGIRLGGHDATGEAFVDFQTALKALKNRGVLLGIVSKNEEEIALEALSRHPEMVLRPADFAGWRINWRDKVANIRDLVQELNLGLQSAVFIDDNQVERSRVREALPEVLVPDWPEDRLLYRKALLDLDCFDTPSITEEDLERTRLYAAERRRVAVRDEAQTFEDWLRTLETRVTVERLNASNLPRGAQLLNKTNQMNLSTRRLSEVELSAWAGDEGHYVWTYRVADKFGDAGLTGIASLEVDQGSATVVDFLLSCRVIGRRVEETVLHHLALAARQLGLRQLTARYVPTPKNKVCLAFWRERSGFEAGADGATFRLNLETPFPLPEAIELDVKDAG